MEPSINLPEPCEVNNPYTCPMELHTHPDKRTSMECDPMAVLWELMNGPL